jgi:hypothetical protein
MNRSSVRGRSAQRDLVSLLVAAGVLVGCSGAGVGCGLLTPFPGAARYAGPRSDDAINLRLSQQGLQTLNASWPQLVRALAPGGTLHVAIPCARQSIDTGLPLIGVQDFYLADQGGPSGGRNDGTCDGRDLPADVAVTITGFSLAAVGGHLEATIGLGVDTGKIYVTNRGTVFCDLACSLAFNDAAAPTTLATTLRLSIDPRWDRLLAFSIDRLGGTEVCGSSGSSPPPACLDPGALSLSSEPGRGGFCIPLSWTCDLLGLGFVKNLVLQLVSPTLQTAVQGLLTSQTCQSCGTGQPPCPVAADGTGSTCTAGVCRDDAAPGACVPRFLGTEGRLDLGALLAAFGAPSAEVDLSVAAGSTVTVDTGLAVGTRVGLQPRQVSACVPPWPEPDGGRPTPPDLEAEATPGTSYDVGLSLSSDFLNRFLWAAHQSGAACLALDTQRLPQVNTGLFRPFLPSLSALATVEGKDAPMVIQLRPARPAELVVGKGTVDPLTGKPGEPLLTVTMRELAIDFYALLEDRQARVFTLTVDVVLPLSLIFEGCDRVTPTLGNLGMLISDVRASNSEMLAEDPGALEATVKAAVSFAEPAIGAALSGLALPTVAGFRLRGKEAKGVGAVAGTGGYQHLGLYAELTPLSSPCAALAPRITAGLQGVQLPTLAQLQGRAPPLPEVVLAVEALGKTGTPQFSARVDDGLWSDFAPAAAGRLHVAQPRLLLQGPHTVSVRARMAEDPAAVSAPAEVPVVIDYEPPQVSLTPDQGRDRLVVRARDQVSASTRLAYAYQVGDEAKSSFGAERALALSEVVASGGVQIWVRDEAGLVAHATFARPASLGASGEDAPAPQGCSATGEGTLALASALLLSLRRRAR